jgi:putative transposase
LRVPFRTAQRWVRQDRKFGFKALVRKSRDHRGNRRVVSPKIKAAIEALSLESPPLPVRSICRQIRQLAETIGEPLLRYGTVYDLVREVPIGLLTLIVAERRTAKSLTWFIDEKRRDKTPSVTVLQVRINGN